MGGTYENMLQELEKHMNFEKAILNTEDVETSTISMIKTGSAPVPGT